MYTSRKGQAIHYILCRHSKPWDIRWTLGLLRRSFCGFWFQVLGCFAVTITRALGVQFLRLWEGKCELVLACSSYCFSVQSEKKAQTSRRWVYCQVPFGKKDARRQACTHTAKRELRSKPPPPPPPQTPKAAKPRYLTCWHPHGALTFCAAFFTSKMHLGSATKGAQFLAIRPFFQGSTLGLVSCLSALQPT